MRVTEVFSLGVKQGGVDFVDVDVDTDVPVYIDPTAIRHQTGPWSEACVTDLQTYFAALLGAIKSSDEEALRDLIYPLVEPNETHLGESSGKSRGRSLGSSAKAEELISALRGSKAVQSGFLSDLEDSALMVEGIDKDIVSDITTCVIRRQLILYTQSQARALGMPMERQASGPMWVRESLRWVDREVDLPRAGGDKLLLVPKSIVRARLTVDKGRYYRGYLRPYFEDELLANPRVGLVRTLKFNRLRVNLGALDEELGTTKPDIVRNTRRFPVALSAYKDALLDEDDGPMSSAVLADKVGAEVEDLREILDEMKAVAPGTAGANLYHRCIARLLSALFEAALGNETIEHPIHDGMKRIDITYDNVARQGFFAWLGAHHPAAMIVVECKNYGSDLKNPEFDQLAMRFSNTRGRVGILACRSFEKKGEALRRAKAIATDDNGFVIILDDTDFEQLVNDYEAAAGDEAARMRHPLLRERFQSLIG